MIEAIDIKDTTIYDNLLEIIGVERKFISLHCHTEFSNFRLVDSINKYSDLIDRAVELGHSGVAITDHEALSSHIKAINYVKKLKKKGKVSEDFKLILGNEIYLVDSLEEVRDNYESGKTKFPHFLLLAKDKIGHEQLRVLSSLAWEESFYTGQMGRVPTTKSNLQKIAKGNHLIASTSCLGGEFPQLVFQLIGAENEYKNNPTKENEQNVKNRKMNIHKFINWCVSVFGKENFFIEIQPSLKLEEEKNKLKSLEVLKEKDSDFEKEYEKQSIVVTHIKEQVLFNEKAIMIAKAYGIDWIATTDVHYLKKEDREIHKAFLNSKDGDREVDVFYMTTYMMDLPELYDKLSDSVSSEDTLKAIDNTAKIGDMVENYDLYHDVIVPRIDLPAFEVGHKFKKWYEKYEYIKNFAYSDDEQDRYYLKLVEDGFYEKESPNTLSEEEFFKRLDRINVELKELWLITEEIHTKLSSYYITTRKIVEIIWNEGNSLVGVARGSAGGWYTAYIMGIVQLNPLDYELPHWRHLDNSRYDLPRITGHQW